MNEQGTDHSGRIVVGVDGSDGSKTALKWAMAQARLTGATVEAVATWQDQVMYGMTYGWAPMPAEGDSVSIIMGKVLDDSITEVSAQLPQPVTVLTRVVEGNPAQVLLAAATGAEMLVVGSRGHGTFAGIVLGSVSQHCVQHAPCPVVVIPE